MKLNWDYSELAESYDDRADYEPKIIEMIFQSHGLHKTAIVLDLGAGTGKLTKELVKHAYRVIASEPNDSMREFGMKNVMNENCEWQSFQGENLPLEENSISSVWFGSSFNVIDHKKLFSELSRVLTKQSWLTCLWNHRNLEDPLQQNIEQVIREEIPGFSYGSRRQDPSQVIKESGMFGEVTHHKSEFVQEYSVDSYIKAWSSHATLMRQSNDREHFEKIVKRIKHTMPSDTVIKVPFTTNLYTSKRIK